MPRDASPSSLPLAGRGREGWFAPFALLLIAPTAALAQAPDLAPLMVRPAEEVAVSAHVRVIPDGSRSLVPNVGFVIGSRAVLVVDTGLGPANGALVAAEAQRLAPGRRLYLVATHAHPEHDMGAQALPAGSVFLRSRAQAADALAQGRTLADAFSARSPAAAALLKDARSRLADETFDGARELDLGGVRVRLIALGPNHTDGDTAAWVPADRVLFSGDTAMRPQPSLMTPRTSLAQWRRTLDRLDALRPAVVVPSHGPVGDAGLIVGYRAYLAEVGERTAAAKARGLDLAATTAEVSAAMSARYPDAARLAGAVRVAYAGAAAAAP